MGLWGSLCTAGSGIRWPLGAPSNSNNSMVAEKPQDGAGGPTRSLFFPFLSRMPVSRFCIKLFFFPLFSFSYKARKGQQPKESVSSLCCCAVPQNLTGRQKSEAGPGACAAQHSARTDIMSNSSIYIYMYHYDVSI